MGTIIRKGIKYGTGLPLEAYDKIAHISNPNLLINPNFKINTKGYTTYPTDNSDRFETVDKWFGQKNISVSLCDEGVTITNISDDQHDMTGFEQDIVNPNDYIGKYLTLSVCAKGTGKAKILPIGLNKSGMKEISLTNEFKVYTATAKVPDDIDKIQSGVCLNDTENSEIIIKYIKLEVGSSASAFTIPTPDVEKAKCIGIDNLIQAEKSTTTNLVKPTLETSTLNGITCTNNGDGTFTLSGTATEYTAFTVCDLHAPENTKFKILGAPSGENPDTGYFLGGLNINHAPYNGKECIFDKSTTYQLDIAVRKDAVCDNVVFKPMITTNMNATYDDFVAYTGDTGKLNSDVAALLKKLSQ